jgi:RNA polymerase sigma factor (sigma-70 family)
MDIQPSVIDAARGGGDDLDRLIALMWPDAYRTALAILHDRGLAEDAAQEACASMARSLPSLKRTELFRGWMYRIVVNRAIAIGRKRRVEENLSGVDPAERDDPTTRIDLYNALAKLPLRERAIVILHYYAGLSSGEIAAACDLPASTIRFHLMHARNRLKEGVSNAQ